MSVVQFTTGARGPSIHLAALLAMSLLAMPDAGQAVDGASVGNRVWSDLNGNGRKTPDEPGIPGVTVHLLPAGSEVPVATQVTNANGTYNFVDVEPGVYSIEVEAPPGTEFTLQDQPPNDVGDSDADANGILGPITLDAGEVDVTWDAGLLTGDAPETAQVGNRVWSDLNGDGRKTPDEPGFAGVVVHLVLDGRIDPVATRVTNANGVYNFHGVEPGVYRIGVVAPEGTVFTLQDEPPNDRGDSDADANGVLGPFALVAGQVDRTWDAGLIVEDSEATANVGNRVWSDLNGNGRKNPDEPGVPGVIVHLIPDGESEPIASLVTNGNGAYNFRGVVAGVYSIEVVAPPGTTFTLQDQLPNDRGDSDADASGTLGPFSLAPGERSMTWAAGLIADPPLLAGLQVAGVDTVFYPAFSPVVERFGLRSGESTDGIMVTATTLQPTDELSIDGAPAQSGVGFEIPAPEPGDEIVVEVARPGGLPRAYTIIYLPVGFPPIQVTILEPGVAEGEIYFSISSPPRFFIVIADNHGVPSFFKEVPTSGGLFQRHPNGQYSYKQNTDRVTETDRTIVEFVIMDADFQEVARYETVDPVVHTDSHDLVILPNGNQLMLAYEPVEHDGEVLEDSVIQEISPDGEEVFQWNSFGEICREWDAEDGCPDGLRQDIEYAHINSVEVDTDGNLLASLRRVSQVVKIDRETSEVIWKLGGRTSDFALDDPLGGPCGQHDAHRLANGNILLFDNGIYCVPDGEPRGFSRAVEYALDLESMTASVAWSYDQDGVYGFATGSAQRLYNGNTLIGWGVRSGILATEVDADGNKVFEIVVLRPDGMPGWSYRVIRFPKDAACISYDGEVPFIRPGCPGSADPE